VNTLLNATSQFAPGGNAGTASSASITDALDSLQSTNLCPESLFRGKLAEFYSQCPEELTSNSVEGVIDIYGVLYAVLPFVGAICSKDANDNYCLLEKISSSSPSSLASDISLQGTSNTQSILDNLVNSPSVERRDSATAVTPNATTFRDAGIPFLFRLPSLNGTELCTTCTRLIFNSYAKFESAVPFAPGLSQSPLLGGQTDLYDAIVKECGDNFLQSSLEAAGGISSTSLLSGSALTANTPGISTVLGLMTLAITFAI